MPGKAGTAAKLLVKVLNNQEPGQEHKCNTDNQYLLLSLLNEQLHA